MSEKNPEQLPPNPTPEQGASMPDIPKSREIFKGDINDAVIQAQLQTGVEIDDGFWFSQVGNDGSTESILDRFDAAYPAFVREKLHISESLEDHKEAVATVGVLAVETAFTEEGESSATAEEDPYGNETLGVYAFMAQENSEKDTSINQEIATELAEEARSLLAEGLSGTEVAERLGSATMVNRRAAQLLYDMGRDLPGRDVPLEKPKEAWDTEEYLNAKYAVIASMQAELEGRNEEYARMTNDLLENGLSYRDVLGDEAARAGSASEHPENAAAYAHELTRLTLEGNGEEIKDAAEDIRRRFDSMRHLLPDSVELSPYAESQSWILWDIGKQEALKNDEYPSTATAGVSYAGSVIKSPEDADQAKQAEFMRDVVAWRHLGWEMHLKAASGEDMGWLNSSLDDQTRSLLHKLGDEARRGQLSSAEYTDLGRGINAALMHRFVQERPELQKEMELRARQLAEAQLNQSFNEYSHRRQDVLQRVNRGELSVTDPSLRELDPQAYIGRQEVTEQYKGFNNLWDEVDVKRDHIASGLDADVYAYNHDGEDYVVRVVKKEVLAANPAKTDDYVTALLHGRGIKGLEQIVAGSYQEGVVVSERAPGSSLKELLASNPEGVNNIPDAHLTQLLTLFGQMQERGLVADVNHGNLIYDEKQGFTLVDYMYCPPEYWSVRGQSLDIKIKALQEMADRHFPGLAKRLAQLESVK